MANDNKLWKSLSQADKMAVIDSFVKRGLTDLDSIRDNYEDGIQKYNNDTAAFLQSLRESNKTNSKNSKAETIEEGNQSVVQEVNNIVEEPAETSRKPVFKQVTTSDVFGDTYKPKEFAAYNKLETGGDKKRRTPLKDLAYRIGADKTINAHGAATLEDIKYALNSEDIPDDIALHTYLYGNDRGLEEVVNSKGFDYSDYLNKVGYDDIKQYNGTIIPDDVYWVGTRNMELANELAKHNAHLYIPTYPDDRSNTFDVGSYIAQLGYNKNGDLIVNASDVYDFYNYGNFDRESKTSTPQSVLLQGKLMEMIGTPYIVRQDNIPIKESSIYGDFPSYDLDNLLDTLADDKIAKLTESGYIEPAIVEADYPEELAFGGNLFGDGGENLTNNDLPIRISAYHNSIPADMSYNRLGYTQLQKENPIYNESFEDPFEFQKEWLKHRKSQIDKQIKFYGDWGIEDTNPDEVLNKINSNIDKLEFYPFGSQQHREYLEYEANRYNTTPEVIEFKDRLEGLQGLSLGNYVIYNPGADDLQSTIVHEIQHGSRLNKMGTLRTEWKHKGPFLYSSDRPSIQILKEGVDPDDYLDNSDEIYSRLMQMRYRNKLDPTHKYTIDEVKAMRNDKNFKSHYIFDRYTDEFILRLLNDIAKNNIDSNNEYNIKYVDKTKNMASYGGVLY
jgi:hypothetical protein